MARSDRQPSRPFHASQEAILLLIAENEYNECAEPLAHAVGNSWNFTYCPSAQAVVFRQAGRGRANRTQAGSLESLEKQIVKVVGPFRTLVRAVQHRDFPDIQLFPTGKILIVFQANVSEGRRYEILQSIKGATITLPPTPEGLPRRERDPRHRTRELLAWAKQEQPSRETLNRLQLPEPGDLRREVHPLAIAFLTLPEADWDKVWDVIEALRSFEDVTAVAPDVHVLGKNVRSQPTLTPPPAVTAADLTANNLIRRAWELFYFHSVVPSPVAGPFLASDRHVAVIDMNFFDHPDIRYLWKGYDAADGDRDPRSPLDPPDADPAAWWVAHGTEMSGVIGGVNQTPASNASVAPGTCIIPIRPEATDPAVDIFQDWDQFSANLVEHWWRALTRLYELSYSDNVEVASMSIAAGINPVILNSLGIQAMFNSATTNGAWGDGIFLAAAAGNNADGNTVAYFGGLACNFGVGEADWSADQVLGNSGFGKDLVVDVGTWPEYRPNGSVMLAPRGSGGSSVSTAVVGGTAALMQQIGSVGLTAEIKKEILRTTGRVSPNQRAGMDSNAWSARYGYGFLDAFYAVTLAFKDFGRPVNALKVRYQAGPTCLLLQVSYLSSDPDFLDSNSGLAWSLQERVDSEGAYWMHQRTQPSYHSDVVIEPISPMGKLLVAGDFDGDGLDEIAAQLGYWVASPQHHFLIEKFSSTDGYWHALGPRYEATEWASGQFVFPQNRPVSQAFAANLEGGASQVLVARQGDVINCGKYDPVADQWTPFGPADYAPPLSSATVRAAFGQVTGARLLHVEKFLQSARADWLLVVGRLRDESWLPGRHHHECLTASVIRYDTATGRYVNVPLDGLGNTHIILARQEHAWFEAVPLDVIVADVDGDQDAEVVVRWGPLSSELILFDCQRMAGNPAIAGHAVYSRSGVLESPLTGFQHGVVDPARPGQEHLAYLSQHDGGNLVRFLRWNSVIREWEKPLPPLAHGRVANEAVDLLVGDFNEDSIAEIGVLMERPHRNTYHVFQAQRNGGALTYEPRGIW